MEQFDTLPSKFRHIEHMHEAVWLQKQFGGGGGGGGKISYVHFLLTFFHFPCDLTLNKLCDHPLLSTYWFKHGNILT